MNCIDITSPITSNEYYMITKKTQFIRAAKAI